MLGALGVGVNRLCARPLGHHLPLALLPLRTVRACWVRPRGARFERARTSADIVGIQIAPELAAGA